jgi:ribosomal protein L20
VDYPTDSRLQAAGYYVQPAYRRNLKKANIALNRKILSEIAIADPAGFDAIVAAAKPSAI